MGAIVPYGGQGAEPPLYVPDCKVHDGKCSDCQYEKSGQDDKSQPSPISTVDCSPTLIRSPTGRPELFPPMSDSVVDGIHTGTGFKRNRIAVESDDKIPSSSLGQWPVVAVNSIRFRG